MKKSIFIAAALFILMACEGPEGPAGPMGQPGQPGQDGRDGEGANWYTTTVTVNANEWKINGTPGDLNTYFYFYKPLSVLNKTIYERGSVIAYIEVEQGIKNGMPYVLHLGEAANEKEFLWTQTYDFDFDEDGVGFYVTYSDFNTQIRPGTETFHLVFMW